MPQWFVPYSAAALVAAALGWLALNYDPDAGRNHAGPRAAAPATQTAADTGAPQAQPTSQPQPAPPPQPTPVAGSGSGDPAPDSMDTDVKAAVMSTVTMALTTDTEENCTTLFTPAAYEQITGEVGDEAIEECREEADGNPDAESLDFRSIQPAGHGYRVAVRLIGPPLGGSRMAMLVVNTDGSWKIDRFVEARFDFSVLIERLRENLGEEGFSDAEITCIADQLSAMNPGEVERAFLEGRAEELGDVNTREQMHCLSAETLRGQIAAGIRAGMGEEIPASLVECVVEQITAGKSAAELRALISRGRAEAAQLGAEAAQLCAQAYGAAA